MAYLFPLMNTNKIWNAFASQYVNGVDKCDSKKRINELIEHKCKQLRRSSSCNKGSIIHLEQWIKGQIEGKLTKTTDEDSDLEFWTDDMVRKRSQELQLVDSEGNYKSKSEEDKRGDSRSEEIIISDQDISPSRSTTTGSQITVRTSPVLPETVNVCRQCHKTCLTSNGNEISNNINVNSKECLGNNRCHQNNGRTCIDEDNNEDDWRPLILMGLTALNPANTLLKLDPFSAPVPQISIFPPSPEPESSIADVTIKNITENCSCEVSKSQPGELPLNKNYNCSPDDSPINDEQPYHSLSSSNVTLRRYGTVPSLEKIGSEDAEEVYDIKDFSSDSDKSDYNVDKDDENNELNNKPLMNNSDIGWKSKAGSYVAEKMAFFEKLGEDYRISSKFFNRYIKTSENTTNGDECQEEETSGATSGEEIWGTPTSGGELDDLSCPNYDGRQSPQDGSISSNGEDTELMMDELLMTPTITSASIRGLLPRRTLEPLLEEEYSDSHSSSTNASITTDPSVSPEQGNGTGDVADACFAAAEKLETHAKNSLEVLNTSMVELSCNLTLPKIHRTDSYRQIIEAENNFVTFFNRFKSRPSMKFINIERIPRTRGIKFLEFFNIRRDRVLFETCSLYKPITKDVKEGTTYDGVTTNYTEKAKSQTRVIDRQFDRRFWKQLSKRRSHQPTT